MIRMLFSGILLWFAVASEAQSEKKPPPPPPPKADVVDFQPPVIIKKELLNDFYKRNPSVDKITSAGHVITLRMKDGTIEKYDMKKKEEEKMFTEKYRESPMLAPPPPPKKLS